MTISIWGEYRGKAEVIDRASSVKEAQYLAGEYRMAFGRDWRVWYGRRDGSVPEKRESRTVQTGHWIASM